jgi:hypothetical protein
MNNPNGKILYSILICLCKLANQLLVCNAEYCANQLLVSEAER